MTLLAAELGQIIDQIVDRHTSSDNGLRESQHAIHYSIAIVGLVDDERYTPNEEEKKGNVVLLLDLCWQFKKMENILIIKA